mmetsp:Transcript_19524/g.30002  ORF Transcript_19524/g.30002 Transcript_19524/m.30002 type:complete len:347 (+) Transcript_19524:3159-4199(+)
MSVNRFFGDKIDSGEFERPQEDLKGSKAERIAQIGNLSKHLRPMAKVVSILDSPNRNSPLMATLVEFNSSQHGMTYDRPDHNQNQLYAAPLNPKMPWFVVDQEPADFTADKKEQRNPSHRYYIIKFGEWQPNQKRPQSTVIESIGEAGNLEAESLRLLKQYDICTDMYEDQNEQLMSHVHEDLKVFSKDINLETNEWKIPEKEIRSRLDLRDKRVFSIDPITAKDLDDALSIERVQDSIYEIGVHIADVSYFVQQGSSLDKEAYRRGTSTYFVHRVFHMLPKLLSERLCSLNPKIDRLAYSVFFRINLKTGQLVKDFKPVIRRTVIRSCAKWSYPLVEKILKGKVT